MTPITRAKLVALTVTLATEYQRTLARQAASAARDGDAPGLAAGGSRIDATSRGRAERGSGGEARTVSALPVSVNVR